MKVKAVKTETVYHLELTEREMQLLTAGFGVSKGYEAVKLANNEFDTNFDFNRKSDSDTFYGIYETLKGSLNVE